MFSENPKKAAFGFQHITKYAYFCKNKPLCDEADFYFALFFIP